MAKYVRFRPETYQQNPCMRVEIFGEEARPGIYHNHKCSSCSLILFRFQIFIVVPDYLQNYNINNIYKDYIK